MSSSIITDPPSSRDQFKSFINSNRHKIIFVKFYADWCNPCQACQPEVLEMFERLNVPKSQKLLVMVNFDTHREIVRLYRVKNIPTIISFKDGEPHNIIVGVDKRKLNFIFFDI
jgi:thioredoxin 1